MLQRCPQSYGLTLSDPTNSCRLLENYYYFFFVLQGENNLIHMPIKNLFFQKLVHEKVNSA